MNESSSLDVRLQNAEKLIINNADLFLATFKSAIKYKTANILYKRNKAFLIKKKVAIDLFNATITKQCINGMLKYLLAHPEHFFYGIKYPYIKSLYSLTVIKEDPNVNTLVWINDSYFISDPRLTNHNTGELEPYSSLGSTVQINTLQNIEEIAYRRIANKKIPQYSEDDVAYAMIDAFCVKTMTLSEDWYKNLLLKAQKREDKKTNSTLEIQKLLKVRTLDKLIKSPLPNIKNNEDDEDDAFKCATALTAKHYKSIAKEQIHEFSQKHELKSSEDILSNAFKIYYMSSYELLWRVGDSDAAKLYTAKESPYIEFLPSITLGIHKEIEIDYEIKKLNISMHDTFRSLHNGLFEKISNISSNNTALTQHFEYQKKYLRRFKNMGASKELMDLLGDGLLKEYSALEMNRMALTLNKKAFNALPTLSDLFATIKSYGGNINEYIPIIKVLLAPLDVTPNANPFALKSNKAATVKNIKYNGDKSNFSVTIENLRNQQLKVIKKTPQPSHDNDDFSLFDNPASVMTYGDSSSTDLTNADEPPIKFNHLTDDYRIDSISKFNFIDAYTGYTNSIRSLIKIISRVNAFNMTEAQLCQYLTQALCVSNIYFEDSLARILNIILVLHADNPNTEYPISNAVSNVVNSMPRRSTVNLYVYDISLVQMEDDTFIKYIKGLYEHTNNEFSEVKVEHAISSLIANQQYNKAYALFLTQNENEVYDSARVIGTSPHITPQNSTFEFKGIINNYLSRTDDISVKLKILHMLFCNLTSEDNTFEDIFDSTISEQSDILNLLPTLDLSRKALFTTRLLTCYLKKTNKEPFELLSTAHDDLKPYVLSIMT